MPTTDAAAERHATNSFDRATLLVALELSRSRWLVTSLSPGSAKLSNHMVAGDAARAARSVDALAEQGDTARRHADRHRGHPGGGLGWVSIHRLLVANGIESHVVEPASIAVPRRHRRTKTDAIDGEMLLRTLAAFKRGETRVCSMVVPPTPAEEDRRRLSRERRTLIKEQVEHGNRIRGLLASQGIRDYRPLRRDCRERLAALHTGDGHPLPPRLTAEILRELDRLELVRQQLAEVEAARDALLTSQEGKAPVKLLLRLTGIGPEFATVLWLEGLFRGFSNRRQLAAYAGLAESVAQRSHRPRAGHLEGGQPQAAHHHDRAGLAVAQVSARVRIEPLVSRACKTIVAAFVGLRSSRSRASC